MENTKYRNKAFLSYRHSEKDERIAALLQTRLERFRVPRRLKKKTGNIPEAGPDISSRGRGLGRIFRDTTDLGARADLTTELQREIEDSEYMIVLCSEEAAGSAWVRREILYFLRTHDASKILPVLVDGEPEEVLPAMFNGIEEMTGHPLACDFRGDKRRALRQELPRLAAALLACSYDELVDRRRRYETRRLALLFTAVVLVLGAVTVYYAVASARIRQSLRAQQVETSNRLAIQSENALTRRQRFDAIRYALDALPPLPAGQAQENTASAERPAGTGHSTGAAGAESRRQAPAGDDLTDRPVTASAMLALQKAVDAYVPEGDRSMAQTGEYKAPDRIHAFDVRQVKDRTYLAVCCEKNETLVWNADTGEALYDSRTEDPGGEDEKQSGSEGAMRLSGDILVRSSGTTLTGIDLTTGKERWKVSQAGIQSWEILDAQEDLIVVCALGTYNEQELQLRRSGDGELIYSRRIEAEPDPGHRAYVYEAAVTRETGRLIYMLNTDAQENEPDFIAASLQESDDTDPSPAAESAGASGNSSPAAGTAVTGGEPSTEAESAGASGDPSPAADPAADAQNMEAAPYESGGPAEGSGPVQALYALDPSTGEETLLAEAERIRDFVSTEDGLVLCAAYEGPEGWHQYSYEDGTAYCYTGTGEESFRILCADPRTGRILWEKKSSCTQDYKTGLLPDLEIEGQKACLLSAGTHVDILAQETGKRLYSFDLPGLMVYVNTGDFQGQEALTAILQDGSRAFYCFSTGEILKKDGVFPDSLAQVKEAGGQYFSLRDEEDRDTSEDRICVFSRELFDPDLLALSTSAEDKNGTEKDSDVRTVITGSQWDYDFDISAGDRFVLEENGCLRCVDARTGQSRWETAVGENIAYAGMTSDEKHLVFRDYIYDGRTLAIRSAQGLPAPEETWRIIDLSDGSMETVKNLMQNIPGNKRWNSFSFAVGGDALVLLAIDDGEEEGWLVRYSISEGTVQTLYLSDFHDRDRDSWLREISVNPDGNTTLCSRINDSALELSLLVTDWKKMETMEINGLKESGISPAISWSAGGSQTALLSTDLGPRVLMDDGSLRTIDTNPEALVRGIGFLGEKPFLVEERGYQVRFLIPQDGIDILLPVDRSVQFAYNMNSAQIYPAYALQDHKVLLHYLTQAFVFSLETGEVETVIDNVRNYNPQTDTLLIGNGEDVPCIAPRYSWQDLVRKGRETVGE